MWLINQLVKHGNSVTGPAPSPYVGHARGE